MPQRSRLAENRSFCRASPSETRYDQRETCKRPNPALPTLVRITPQHNWCFPRERLTASACFAAPSSVTAPLLNQESHRTAQIPLSPQPPPAPVHFLACSLHPQLSPSPKTSLSLSPTPQPCCTFCFAASSSSLSNEPALLPCLQHSTAQVWH